MADACTIVCTRDDRSEALRCLLAHAPAMPSVTGPEDRWEKVEVLLPNSRLTLNALYRIKPMDEFSKLGLKMSNYFRRIKTAHEVIRDDLEQRILKAKLMIGVVADPAFVDEDGHYECVFSIAQALEGVVFSGDRMLDENGRVLLTATGESEVA